MTKNRRFKRSYAKSLMRIARGDLESARGLFESRRGRPENVCYLAQQSIEKALKAALCADDKVVPLTHSIELLLDRLAPDFVPASSDALIELTDFAMIRRYNEGNDIISDEDMLDVLEAAEQLLDAVDSRIGPIEGN